MSFITVNTIAINGKRCEGTRQVNCNLLQGSAKDVWIIDDEVGLLKMDYENNGGDAGVVIYEGGTQIVVTDTVADIKTACCCD